MVRSVVANAKLSSVSWTLKSSIIYQIAPGFANSPVSLWMIVFVMGFFLYIFHDGNLTKITMKKLLFTLAVSLMLFSCGQEKDVQLLSEFVNDSYKYSGINALQDDPEFEAEKSRRRNRRARISEVPVDQNIPEPELPEWITDNQYVTSNIAAIKYKPSVLIGAIVRKYEDGSFEVATASNIRKGNILPEFKIVEKPLNFYERTFSNVASLNASFVIGSVNIESDEALKIAYTETSYLIAESTDEQKKEKYKAEILDNPDAKKSDWAFVRGIVTVDCSYSRYKSLGGNVSANASFVSVGLELYQKQGETNNFRLVAIDIESLWLN